MRQSLLGEFSIYFPYPCGMSEQGDYQVLMPNAKYWTVVCLSAPSPWFQGPCHITINALNLWAKDANLPGYFVASPGYGKPSGFMHKDGRFFDEHQARGAIAKFMELINNG